MDCRYCTHVCYFEKMSKYAFPLGLQRRRKRPRRQASSWPTRLPGTLFPWLCSARPSPSQPGLSSATSITRSCPFLKWSERDSQKKKSPGSLHLGKRQNQAFCLNGFYRSFDVRGQKSLLTRGQPDVKPVLGCLLLFNVYVILQNYFFAMFWIIIKDMYEDQ